MNKLKDWATWVLAFFAYCALFLANMISEVTYTLGDLLVFAIMIGFMYNHPDYVKKHEFMTFILFTVAWGVYTVIFKRIYARMQVFVHGVVKVNKQEEN